MRPASRLSFDLCAFGLALSLTGAVSAQPAVPASVVATIYEAPKNPAHQPVLDLLREKRALEKAAEFYRLFRLPRPLTLKAKGCDGEIDAWFENDEITICYEYVAYVLDIARDPKRPDWVSENDALVGPVIDLFLHEGGHAIFDYLKIPVLGNEEDAADFVASYVELNLYKADAYGLIAGIVYCYLNEAGVHSFKKLKRMPGGPVDGQTFADAHSTPLQRMYNVLCLAYGSDPVRYKALIDKGVLPAERASGCKVEYEQVDHAFKTLLVPHIDQAALARLFPQVSSAAPK